MAVQSQDIASLFKELEDASKLAKLEEKNNKETTKKQVKELDSFLTSVQKVVKVIEKKDDDTPIKPKKVTPKVEKKSKPNGKVQEQSKPVEKKSLSKDDTKKLDAFSGLIKSFGVEIIIMNLFYLRLRVIKARLSIIPMFLCMLALT